MLELKLVKQALENNNKNKINPAILDKIIKSRVMQDVKISFDWQINNCIKDINNANELSDEQKGELVGSLKADCYKCYEDIKKAYEELFGSEEKQASTVTDKNTNTTSGEKEEIGKSEEGESSEEAQDDPKDDKKTPAEFVNEQKPGQSIFNY